MRRVNIILISALLALQACGKDPVPDAVESIVRVWTTVSVEGKSSITGREEDVNSFLVLAYGPEGMLESWGGPDNPALELRLGVRYKVYAMINMGELSVSDFVLREDLLSFRFEGTPNDFRHCGIPASGYVGCIFTEGDRYELLIPCRRLVSRYDISLIRDYSDASASFTVTDARICQSSCLVTPFKEGYAAGSPEDLSDGDYASFEDIAVLNDLSCPETGKVHFYMFENMQGVPPGLESNTDPWRKTPENAEEIADLATFLEIKGRYESQSEAGTLTYRVYLGRNAVSDFNVERNVNYSLALRLTDNGLSASSWKAEADMEYDAWAPDGIEFVFSSPTQEFASCMAGGRINWYDDRGEEHSMDEAHRNLVEIRAYDSDGNDVTSFTEFRYGEGGSWEMEFNTPEMKSLGPLDEAVTYRLCIIYEEEVYDEQEIIFYEIIDDVSSAFYTWEANGRGVHPFGILSLGFDVVCCDGKEASVMYGYEGHCGWQYFHLGSDSLEYDLIWGSHPDPDDYLQNLCFLLRTYEYEWISSDVCIVDSSVQVDIPFSLYDIRYIRE